MPSVSAIDISQGLDLRVFERLLALSTDCIKLLDASAHVLFINEGGMRAMGISDFRSVAGRPWSELWPSEARGQIEAAVAAAKDGRPARFQGLRKAAQGQTKHWDVQVSAIVDGRGRANRLLVISRDISDIKEAEAHKQLLIAELSHRGKNILAIVQAVAGLTFRNAKTLAEAKTRFADRLVALSQTHDLLTQSDGLEASLADIVSGMLRPFVPAEAPEFAECGPPLVLGSKSAPAFALLWGELLTHCLRRGAFAGESPLFSVSWRIQDAAEGQTLLFACEASAHGRAPLQHRRFGSRDMERAMASALGARIASSYLGARMRFEIETPVATLVQ